LENIIYRSAVMAQGDSILIKDLPQEVIDSVGDLPVLAESTATAAAAPDLDTELGAPAVAPFDAAYQQLRAEQGSNILEHAERALIARALAETGGKQAPAAKILGMTRATLRKRIDQYDLA
jgi:two-component system nitrogen regulation response regulator GlnG